jgi:hypothetical protein
VVKHKKTGPAFGPRCTVRPDVLSDADTIVLPTVAWDAPRSIDTAAERPGSPPPWSAQIRSAPEPDEGYVPTRRRTLISRVALLAILCLQAAMSLRLRNTAFEDEALYLFVGRLEIAHLLHGAPLPTDYAAYFSGAPVLYPVLAAALNSVGGLGLARALSLAEIMAITGMLYSCTRFLFNERVALCAAALFSVTEPALFLGNFATFDATCLFLLAGGTTIVVRTSRSRRPLFLLAAPIVALAVAVKYAGMLFVPTIAVLVALAGWPALTGWPSPRRRAVLRVLAFCAAVAVLLLIGASLGGHDFLNGLTTTTTARAGGATAPLVVLRESTRWCGVVFALAVIGTIGYTRRIRTEPGELIATVGRRPLRAALGAVLTGTALLAPVYQMHLHTDVSLHKHVGFGLFFAAPMAGLGLTRLIGDHFRRPQLGVAAWSIALVLGMSQSWTLYHDWPSANPFVRAFSSYLKPGTRYLVEVPEVLVYYLEGRADAQPAQFFSTFAISYATPASRAIPAGKVLTGVPGFIAAVRAGYYHAIAYNGEITPDVDAAIARTLRTNHAYRLAAVVHLSDSEGPVNYHIWVKRDPPAAHAAPQKKSPTAHAALKKK